ncbi:MAG: hypothetical protein RIC16_01010 [Rhodospirillales bacterium]
MPENTDKTLTHSSTEFHDKLSADAVLTVLREAQDTVRSYDVKAQICGVGYIFALGVVQRSGDQMPIPVEFAVWYVLAGWLVIVLPILMFAMVLYPSRVDKIARKHWPDHVLGTMYFERHQFEGVTDYAAAALKADWAREVAFEIIKVSEIRDLKRIRFLRALYWAAGSFTVLFLSQMLRASGVLT